MADQGEERHDGSIFDKVPISEERGKGPCIPGSHVNVLGIGDKSDVALDVIGSFVVLGVCKAPGIVRDQEQRVDHESDAVVNCF